jgi:hypothetical protein
MPEQQTVETSRGRSPLGGEYWCVLRFTPVLLIPKVLQCKAQVCGRSIVGITASNPAEGMGFRVLCLSCFM